MPSVSVLLRAGLKSCNDTREPPSARAAEPGGLLTLFLEDLLERMDRMPEIVLDRPGPSAGRIAMSLRKAVCAKSRRPTLRAVAYHDAVSRAHRRR